MSDLCYKVIVLTCCRCTSQYCHPHPGCWPHGLTFPPLSETSMALRSLELFLTFEGGAICQAWRMGNLALSGCCQASAKGWGGQSLGATGIERWMKEGLEVRRGFLEEVDLRLDGDRFREKNGISGEDMENTLDFEAQRMRCFFFSFAVFSFQCRQNSASISKTLFFFSS